MRKTKPKKQVNTVKQTESPIVRFVLPNMPTDEELDEFLDALKEQAKLKEARDDPGRENSNPEKMA